MQQKDVFSQFHHEINPNYDFHDLSAFSGDKSELKPDEGIKFGDFDSVKRGWWLTKRDAPIPEEYEIVDSVPYMQGEYDFSVLNQERYYKKRELTYEFIVVDDDYAYRKGEEEAAKRLLTTPPKLKSLNNLYDSHDPTYYFKKAKCTSFSADDDAEKGVLTVTVKFKTYPYAISREHEGNDIWDYIDFDNYADNVWTYQFNLAVNESKRFDIYNTGKPVIAKISSANDTKFTWEDYTYKDVTNDRHVMMPGHNWCTALCEKGGWVKIDWRREVMI